MKLKFLYLLVISIFVTGLTAGQNAAEIPNLLKAYQLGPGDEITVSVINEKEYDFKTVVDRNGFIEIPFNEGTPISVKCKTEREVKGEITTLLAKYLKKPQISLLITEKSQPVATVYGEVVDPQKLELRRKVTLLEAIAFSGGVKEEAGGLIQVIRTQPPACEDVAEWKPDPEDESKTRFKMYSISELNGGTEDVNPVIYPGDIVVVLKALPVYINGEVRQPQGIYLKEGGTTLTEAIAKVGGISQGAKTKDIKIYRLIKGTKDREVISANFNLIQTNKQKDPILQPYDMVIVDKAKESLAKSILNVALGAGKAIVTSSSYNIGYRVVY